MGPHDITGVRPTDNGTVIVCACSRVFQPPTAREDHADHHRFERDREIARAGIAAARQALKGDG